MVPALKGLTGTVMIAQVSDAMKGSESAWEQVPALMILGICFVVVTWLDQRARTASDDKWRATIEANDEKWQALFSAIGEGCHRHADAREEKIKDFIREFRSGGG